MKVDVLEYGEALLAARPRLIGLANWLLADAEAAQRLVRATLAQVWRDRRRLPPQAITPARLAAEMRAIAATL